MPKLRVTIPEPGTSNGDAHFIGALDVTLASSTTSSTSGIGESRVPPRSPTLSPGSDGTSISGESSTDFVRLLGLFIALVVTVLRFRFFTDSSEGASSVMCVAHDFVFSLDFSFACGVAFVRLRLTGDGSSTSDETSKRFRPRIIGVSVG